MKKYLLWFLAVSLLAILFLAGCAMDEGSAGDGERLEFTVVSPEEIPSELRDIIEKNKESEIMMSYKIEDYFYLVRGYGKQDTGGYSITVTGVSLKEDGIHMSASLLGPPAGEEIPKGPSCPCVVVKIPYMEKQVFFD